MNEFVSAISRAAWVGLALAVLSFALRFTPPLHPLGLLLAGVFPFLSIGAGASLLVAAASRRRALAGASVAVMLAAAVTINPFDAVVDCRRLAERSTDSLVIYQTNVLQESDGGVPDRYRADILLADADVVLLQEVTPAFASALDDGSLAHLRYRTTGATVVWSRLPIVELPTGLNSGVVPVLIDDGFGLIEIASVHTAAPFSSERLDWWQEQFDDLSESIIDDERARILGGDFNATDAHRPFRELLGTGLTDVHDVAGCGMDATWPIRTVGPVSPPPILRLDHVLISEHFDVVGLRVGPAIDQPLGSDHHPVVVELRRS